MIIRTLAKQNQIRFGNFECTVLVLRMARRIWKETKQQPGTAGPGNMLGSCLVSFHFLWAILSTSTVEVEASDDRTADRK